MKIIMETVTSVPVLWIVVYDMQGRRMLQFKGSAEAGKTTLSIPTGKLANGKYTVVVFNNQKRIAVTGIIKL